MKKRLISVLALACFALVIVFHSLFELMLNDLLVSLYQNSVFAILGDQQQQAQAVGLLGRIVSGFGLTLILFSLLWSWRPEPEVEDEPAAATSRLAYVQHWGLGLMGFLVTWSAITLALGVLIDYLAINASPRAKLAGVRTVLFREAYQRGNVEFAKLPELARYVQNPSHRKITTALMPSLGYFSPHFRTQIRDKTENIIAQNMENHRRRDFNKALPQKLDQVDATFTREWNRYQQFQVQLSKARQAHSPAAIQARYRQVMHLLHRYRDSLWAQFQTDTDPDTLKTFADNTALALYGQKIKTHKALKNCDGKPACRQKVLGDWKQRIISRKMVYHSDDYWLKDSTLRGLGLIVTAPLSLPGCLVEGLARALVHGKGHCRDVILAATNLDDKALASRKAFLRQQYGISLSAGRSAFVHSDYVAGKLAAKLKSLGYDLGDQWHERDAVRLLTRIRADAKDAVKKVTKQYRATSTITITQPGLSRQTFAQTKAARDYFQQTLGQYYYSAYHPGERTEQFYAHWKQQQPSNLWVIHMFTDKALVQFAPGGAFFQLGTEAVKFSIIPPIAILTSAIAVLGLWLKFLWLIGRRSAGRYHTTVFFVVFAVVVAAYPVSPKIQRRVETPNSGAHLMQTMIQRSSHDFSTTDRWVTRGFGVGLDLENAVYQLAQTKDTQAQSLLHWMLSNTAALRLRHWAATARGWADDYFLGQRGDPYNLHIAIYDKDFHWAYAMALQVSKHYQVNQVYWPSFHGTNRLDDFLDIPLFFDPNYKQLLYQSASNYDDASYWYGLYSGDALKDSLRDRLDKATASYLNQHRHGGPFLFYGKEPVQQGFLMVIKHPADKANQCFYMQAMNLESLKTLAIDNRQRLHGGATCHGELL